MSIQKIKENIKHHKRKIRKWVKRIFIIGLIGIIICLYFINFAQEKEKELAEKTLEIYKNFYESDILKRVEKNELYIENLKNMINGGDGIWEVASRSAEQTFFLNNMTDNQKQIQYELHGKNTLRYDWMINPVENGIVSMKNSEFYRPRYTDGKWRPHLGLDQIANTTMGIKAACAGVVSQTGYTDIGGKFIIIETIRNEYIEKKKKYEDVLYENYYGHLAEINVVQGQQVKQGQRIAIMGNTGPKGLGIHLHWAIKEDNIIMNPIVNTTWGNKIVPFAKAEGF
jgi:murein DD-endopeptidase MepM/ murein hydrolase activator NlpD